jgi:hypothetical protein
MAWVTPGTAVTNATYTAAQHNAWVRDNLLETLVAKVTAAGQIGVSTGPNALSARGLGGSRVTGGPQTTSSAAFTDMTTVGPTVTLTTGTTALVLTTSFVMNTTAGQGGYMGYTVSGASTIAADATRALRIMSGAASERARLTAATWQTGLNAGSNTFTARYAVVASGTAEFDEREIIVLPLS